MLPGSDPDYLVLRSRRLFIDNLMDIDKELSGSLTTALAVVFRLSSTRERATRNEPGADVRASEARRRKPPAVRRDPPRRVERSSDYGRQLGEARRSGRPRSRTVR